MPKLATRIRPPFVALIVAAGMWWLAPATPALALPPAARVAVAASLVVLGLGMAIAGLAAFHRAKTTHDPLRPEQASALVATGIYRVTRNPMYLGIVLCLVALAVVRPSLWALLGPVAFVAYMNRFQIAPEEAALHAKFGARYAAYKARVRRWL